MTRLGLTAAVLAAGALLCSSNANANEMTVNAAVPPGATVTLASVAFPNGGPPTHLPYAGSILPFSSVTGSSLALVGAPGSLTFDSNNISFALGGPSTLFVWITVSDLTAPAAESIHVHSGLTSNDLGTGLSATLFTYVDEGNHVAPPVGTLQATMSWTGPCAPCLPNLDKNTLASTGDGPYSIQEVYQVVATRAGFANLTIDVETSAIPEPATLGLLGTGLLAGVGFLRRRRG